VENRPVSTVKSQQPQQGASRSAGVATATATRHTNVRPQQYQTAGKLQLNSGERLLMVYPARQTVRSMSHKRLRRRAVCWFISSVNAVLSDRAARGYIPRKVRNIQKRVLFDTTYVFAVAGCQQTKSSNRHHPVCYTRRRTYGLDHGSPQARI